MKVFSRLLAVALGFLVVASFTAHAQKKTAKELYDSDPQMVEIREYKLTMDKIERLAHTSEQLEALIKADPSMKTALNPNNNDSQKDMNLTEAATALSVKYPKAAAVVVANGFTPREYFVALMAVFNDGLWVGMKKAGQVKDYDPHAITPQNAAFLEQNWEKLEPLLKKALPMNSDSNN
jgi:hypothetical protein